MTQNEIVYIQKILFDLFKQIHKLCEDNKIRYFFLGGTMLGAVRHKGFIPWDDDIDIGMPREDYIRFLDIISKPQTEINCSVLNNTSTTKCSYDFTKLLPQKTKIENNKYDIFIDVFPLDGCPFSSERGIYIYYFVFNLLRIAKNSHFMDVNKGSILRRLIIRFFRIIPLNNWQLIMKWYLTRFSFDKSKTVGNFSGHWGAKEIMDKMIYGNPTKLFFVDGEYYGVSNPDKYLSRMYGDYMKMPSEEERLSHFN